MDVVTLATEQLGGVLAAALLSMLLRRLRLGALGIMVVGLVGGAVGGLVLMQYAAASPVTLSVSELNAFAIHLASGAAGGALLALLTGFLTSRANA